MNCVGCFLIVYSSAQHNSPLFEFWKRSFYCVQVQLQSLIAIKCLSNSFTGHVSENTKGCFKMRPIHATSVMICPLADTWTLLCDVAAKDDPFINKAMNVFLQLAVKHFYSSKLRISALFLLWCLWSHFPWTWHQPGPIFHLKLHSFSTRFRP